MKRTVSCKDYDKRKLLKMSPSIVTKRLNPIQQFVNSRTVRHDPPFIFHEAREELGKTADSPAKIHSFLEKSRFFPLAEEKKYDILFKLVPPCGYPIL